MQKWTELARTALQGAVFEYINPDFWTYRNFLRVMSGVLLSYQLFRVIDLGAECGAGPALQLTKPVWGWRYGGYAQ